MRLLPIARLASRRPLVQLARPQPFALHIARHLNTRLGPKAVPEGSAYAVLGVPREVTPDTLKAVYKQLVRVIVYAIHPYAHPRVDNHVY